jgi:hypothetical protein
MRVEVDVGVHATEQTLLRAPTPASGQNDQVVAAALELPNDLWPGAPTTLDPVSDRSQQGCSETPCRVGGKHRRHRPDRRVDAPLAAGLSRPVQRAMCTRESSTRKRLQ